MRTPGIIEKLRAMSTTEIAYRCGEKVRVQKDRVGTLLRNSMPPFYTRETCVMHDYILTEPAGRFFVPEDRRPLRNLVQQVFPEWITRAVTDADRICAGRLSILGCGEVRMSPVVDWCADPYSGARWPRRFWADYDLVHQCGTGDPKVVHEFNRHQHLATLARAYSYSGDERYATEAIAQLESWIAQNPEGVGINWNSSLEIAIRAVSWLWIVFLLLPSEQLDDQRVEKILKVLFSHFDHIRRFPSLYSSPNTHLIGEAAALYIGGTIFSELKEGREWRDFGESVLIDESVRQVLADGMHGELSTYYHCYTIEFYLMAMAMARRVHAEFPEPVRRRVESMLEMLVHMSRPDGSIPLLSDDDGGRAMGLCRNNYRDVRDLLSTGAVLFGRPEFKWRAGAFREESMWLLGPEGFAEFEQLNSIPPALLNRIYPNAGYFVGRSGWNDSDDQLVFDCGGIGFLGGGHGHADALSLVLSVRGSDLLVDPGTAVYNGKPKWREFFRSTRAHNTVMIDGKDQAEPTDTFRWKNGFNCRIVNQFSPSLDGSRSTEYVEAEHDAYARLEHPVTHRRRILRVRPECWVVADDFRGTGQHRMDSFFHFAPEARVVLDPKSSLTSAGIHSSDGQRGLKLAFHASSNVHAEIVRGSEHPVQGWYSPQYGDMQPSSVLCLTMNDTMPSAAITVLIPTAADGAGGACGACGDDEPTVHEQLIQGTSGSLGVACSLEHRGRRDLFVMALHDSPVRILNFELRGEFFWLRSVNDEVCELFGINASYVASNGEVLFENHSPVPCMKVWIEQGVYVRY